MKNLKEIGTIHVRATTQREKWMKIEEKFQLTLAALKNNYDDEVKAATKRYIAQMNDLMSS